MTTPDLERRLADLLRERAEGAMEKTNTQEKLSSLLGDRSDVQRRRLWAAGGVVVAAAAVAIAIVIARGDVDRSEQTPVDRPDTAAVALASSFLEATYADPDRAAGMLSPDVQIVDEADVDDWRKHRNWQEAAGFRLVRPSCEQSSASTEWTEVQCSFALHALGSQELGLGPYGGATLDVRVVDAEIIRVWERFPYNGSGFSDEMWEPFARWVSSAHPADAGVMYQDSAQTEPRLDDRSLRLWTQRIVEYVDTHR